MGKFQRQYDTQKRSSQWQWGLPARGKALSRGGDQPLLASPQAFGNQAAQKFAQTCPLTLPSPLSCPFGGICHSCPPRVQAKLQVGQPGDKYEQEADRVAAEILRQPEAMAEGGPGSLAPPQPLSLMRSCAPCDEELRRLPLEECEEPRCPEEEVEMTLLPKGLPGQTQQVSPAVEAAISGSLAGGSPLPGALRDFYEPRFGQDFSGVRLHMDAQAAGAAQTVQARAFTLGHHIVLGSGEYAPETEKGRKLLAHELTHVVQQRAGMAPPAIPLIQLTNGAPAAVEPPFLDCIPDITGVVHQEVINEMIQDATELAIEWIGDSIDALTRLIDNTGTPDDSLALQNHFPGGRRHFIRNRFRNMRTILQRTNIDIFVCNPADSHYCSQEPFGYGYIRQVGGIIHLCPFWFTLNLLWRAMGVIHEAAHVAGGSFDDCYVHQDCYPPHDAHENAESYAYFAFSI